VGAAVIALLAVLAHTYMHAVGGQPCNRRGRSDVLVVDVTGLSRDVPTSAIMSSLRATGIVLPVMVISALTVIINVALAPVLIAGWGTGVAFGVGGAGMATSLSLIFGLIILSAYFQRSERYLTIAWRTMAPALQIWRQVLRIGWPTSAELVATFLCTAAAYYFVRGFGSVTQAAYGVGLRVMQLLSLPGVAIGSVSPHCRTKRRSRRLRTRPPHISYCSADCGRIMAAITVMYSSRRKNCWRYLSRIGGDCAGRTFLAIDAWTFIAQSWLHMHQHVSGTRNNSPLLAEPWRQLSASLSQHCSSLPERNFFRSSGMYLLVASTLTAFSC